MHYDFRYPQNESSHSLNKTCAGFYKVLLLRTEDAFSVFSEFVFYLFIFYFFEIQIRKIK